MRFLASGFLLAVLALSAEGACPGVTIGWDRCTSNGRLYVRPTVQVAAGNPAASYTVTGFGPNGTTRTDGVCNSGMSSDAKCLVPSDSQQVTVSISQGNPVSCTDSKSMSYKQITSTYGPSCIR